MLEGAVNVLAAPIKGVEWGFPGNKEANQGVRRDYSENGIVWRLPDRAGSGHSSE